MKDEIEITVIGCGDAFASGGRFHSCFFIESARCNVLVDCGASAFTSLKQQGIENNDIDVILISHFHGDHYGGVPFFLLDAEFSKRDKPLTIVSPPGGKGKVEQLFALLYPGSKFGQEPMIRFQEYADNTAFIMEGLSFLAVPVRHKEATLPHGLRMTIGLSIISYSGDTGWTPSLEKLAKDADLFICECNFYVSDVEGHMNYKTLTENLGKLAFKRILLTHLGEEMLRNIEKVELESAVDGLKITI